MTSRMEKVAEDIALNALRKATQTAELPLKLETLTEAFKGRWLLPGSDRPMNDAMSAAVQAASNCTDQDAESWEGTVSQVWQPAVQETVEEYFKTARHSFQKGEALEGAETLTDAVRATLAISPWPATGPTAPTTTSTASPQPWEAAADGPIQQKSSTGLWKTPPKRGKT